jgi:ATP-dependent exoDNAse (exonuclease V) beta subunit
VAIKKYVKEVNYDDYINKDYLDFMSSSYDEKIKRVTPINYSDYEFNKTTINKAQISHKILDVITKDEALVLKIGTRLHEVMETLDFNNINLEVFNLNKREEEMLNNVLSLDCFKNISSAKVYKEYEFMYEDDGNLYHGIIDLLVEYDDHFEIIDYKLSDIDKPEYEVQLNEYYKYISKISNKNVKMYLLSLTKAKLKEVFVIQ